MADRAAAPLQQSAANWEAGVVEIQERHHLADGLLVEKLGVDAVNAHRISAPGESIALAIGVIKIEHAALADHGVVIDVLLEAFPQFHGLLVERDVAGQQVVGADDRRVAADVAAADPALLDDGNSRQAEILGEVVGRRETVAAAANNHDVVVGFWFGIPPRRTPAGVAAQCLAKH